MLACVPAVLIVFFLRVPVPAALHDGGRPMGLRGLLREPRFFLAMFMIALVGATEEGLAQWLPAYAERQLGYSKATAGLALAGFGVAMGVGRWLASRPGGGANGHVRVAAAAGLCVLLYGVAAWAPAPPLALAACVTVGLACSLLWPTNLAITADRFAAGGATMCALLAAAGNLGCLAAPWTEGIIASHTNLRVALGAGMAAPLLLAALALAARRADTRHGPGAQA